MSVKLSYARETFLPNRKILIFESKMRFISIVPAVSLANDYFGDKVYRVKVETEDHLLWGFKIIENLTDQLHYMNYI